MSLINQMLKELDARRSEVAGADSYGQQIRAVPERRRMHPAWFAAAAATLLLIVVLMWILLRPTPRQELSPTMLQLPLKLDVDLTAVSVPGTETSTATDSSPTSAAQINKADSADLKPAASTDSNSSNSPNSSNSSDRSNNSDRSNSSNGLNGEKEHSMLGDKAPALSQPRTSEKERKPSGETSMPIVSRIVPEAKTLAAQPVKEASPNATHVLKKQFKELTPQQRAENEYRKALQAMHDSKLAEAIKGFESALHLDTYHVSARYALIGALLDSHRQDEAIARASEGLLLDPAQPGLSMILARLQVEKGGVRLAIETLERALPYAADRADYQAFLAALMQRDERHKQAIEHYLAALRKAPQNGLWWMGIGISLQAERRTSEALEAFKRAKASNSLSQELIAFVDSRLTQLQR